jgi:hypothetical protein
MPIILPLADRPGEGSLCPSRPISGEPLPSWESVANSGLNFAQQFIGPPPKSYTGMAIADSVLPGGYDNQPRRWDALWAARSDTAGAQAANPLFPAYVTDDPLHPSPALCALRPNATHPMAECPITDPRSGCYSLAAQHDAWKGWPDAHFYTGEGDAQAPRSVYAHYSTHHGVPHQDHYDGPTGW